MLEINQNGLRAAMALLLCFVFTFTRATQAPAISSHGNLNWPVSPLSECPTRTVNYITAILPPQCMETAWTPPLIPVSQEGNQLHATGDDLSSNTIIAVEGIITAIHSPETSLIASSDGIESSSDENLITKDNTNNTVSTPQTIKGLQGLEVTPEVTPNVDQDNEADSPLDNAKFLSFEEWKKQNLAKAGQSVANIGQRAGASKAEPRKRPGSITNALDSLGEDTEIEIDFGGFVGPDKANYDVNSSNAVAKNERATAEAVVVENQRGAGASGSHVRGKDAGKTCKERFNYASFDCAATVLKTNKESKGSTSVLVENKDSYMLNKCSADNKFFIVELCEDILVDTVVLANFEFFSSMFRTFRVSVSDRYPVKLDKWRVLGTFEARNSREVQAFLIESPLIWARYLRVEFLAHYGNEYYCPVSLLRVHGTTMMEEFNHDMKGVRGDEETEVENGEEEGESLESDSGVITADALKEDLLMPAKHAETEAAPSVTRLLFLSQVLTALDHPKNSPRADISTPSSTYFDARANSGLEAVVADLNEYGLLCPLTDDPDLILTSTPSTLASTSHSPMSTKEIEDLSDSVQNLSGKPTSNPQSTQPAHYSVPNAPVRSGSSHVAGSTGPSIHAKESPIPQSNIKVSTTSTQPPAANPTTQESFFKSVHKRLQLLESNSTLSLQYIEEQSRILRDAFAAVEKRQLAKTAAFLTSLNSTVLDEVHAFRAQYDNIWQSTVLELASQRNQSRHELVTLSTRLSVLADEIVFQKRMAIVQFGLILLCLGLVIFSRVSSSPSPSYSQHSTAFFQPVVDKSTANLARYAHLETPRSSPSSTRPSSRYGIFGRGSSSARSASEESDSLPAVPGMVLLGSSDRGAMDRMTNVWNGGDVHKGPSIEYSPPTPTSSQTIEAPEERIG